MWRNHHKRPLFQDSQFLKKSSRIRQPRFPSIFRQSSPKISTNQYFIIIKVINVSILFRNAPHFITSNFSKGDRESFNLELERRDGRHFPDIFRRTITIRHRKSRWSHISYELRLSVFRFYSETVMFAMWRCSFERTANGLWRNTALFRHLGQPYSRFTTSLIESHRKGGRLRWPVSIWKMALIYRTETGLWWKARWNVAYSR